MSPSPRVQAGNVEQLSRCAIRLRCIVDDARVGMDDLANHLGELTNRDVLTGADIDVFDPVVVLHQKDAGPRKIIDMEELAPRRQGVE